MNKAFLAICVVLTIAAVMIIGGVFATFRYAQSPADSDSQNLNASIGEFDYNTTSFNDVLQSVADIAQNDKTYGLNAQGASAGMRKAIVYASIFGRAGYGYVGSMDQTYGKDVYGREVIENVSMVITFAKEIGGKQTIYIYIVNKSKEELAAMNVGDTLNDVYRMTFVKDNTTTNDFDLTLTSDGNPDIRKGSSAVYNYEGQTNGAKTFGFHGGREIFAEDAP